jgi:hypothetical protein
MAIRDPADQRWVGTQGGLHLLGEAAGGVVGQQVALAGVGVATARLQGAP